MSPIRRSKRIMDRMQKPPKQCSCILSDAFVPNSSKHRTSQTSSRSIGISSNKLQLSAELPGSAPLLIKYELNLNKGRRTSRTISQKLQSLPNQMLIKYEPWQGPTNPSHSNIEPMLTFSSPNENKLPPVTPTSSKHESLFKFPLISQTYCKKEPTDKTQTHSPSNLTFSSANIKMREDEGALNQLVCQVCQVSCSSGLTLQQHLKGRPHKAKMEFIKLKNIGGEWKPRCDVCQIWCSDRALLEMHFKGQKHKRNQQTTASSGPIPIVCEVCCVPCMNQHSYQMHLNGKKHATKLARHH